MNKQVIYGTVPSKSNSYKIGTIRGHSTILKTSSVKAYEDSFMMQCNLYRNANIAGRFEFYLDVFYPSDRSDLDGSFKVIMDCLQSVKAIKNDRKCLKIVAQKFVDKANPRIEFIIKEV